MPGRLDHLVILVKDLEGAAEDYGRLGFRVTPGGEHADGLTRNALVPFRDGSYLELVAFVDPEGTADNVWGWRKFSSREGLIDYCAASDDLGQEVRQLREMGFRTDGPHDGGRRLPDGGEIRWRSASIAQDGKLLPFLIEDLTPRSRRVPSGPAADHPNGATGTARLEISTPDPRGARGRLAALTGTAPEAPSLGTCELVVPAGRREEREGPSVARLWTRASEGTGELDEALAHGARLVLTPRG